VSQMPGGPMEKFEKQFQEQHPLFQGLKIARGTLAGVGAARRLGGPREKAPKQTAPKQTRQLAGKRRIASLRTR
jgi:hypothetical protein